MRLPYLIFLAALPLTAAFDYREAAEYRGPGNGVRFEVYSEHASTVHVAGEFNGFSFSAHPLTKDPATDLWSATVGTAQPGQKYQYVVNGTKLIKDPMSLQVENSGGSADSIIVDLDAYDWSAESASWQTPPIEQLLIYECHIPSFIGTNDGLSNAPGTRLDVFTDNKLDYLANLGVNALAILPVHEHPGDWSWGYSPAFFSAIESSLGSPEDLQRLVDEAHKRGIAVILDVCYNHVSFNDTGHYYNFDDCPVTNLEEGNGAWYYPSPLGPTPWGPEIRWDDARVREVIIDNAKMFLEKYRFDGFRIDSTQTIRKDTYDNFNKNDWEGTADVNGEIFMREFNDAVRPYNNGRAITIAEDLANDPYLTRNTSDQSGFGFMSQWAQMWSLEGPLAQTNDAFRSMGQLASVLRADGQNWNYGPHELIRFHTSHDTARYNRFPNRLGDVNNAAVKKRALLGNLFVIASRGTPMIFMGDEFYQTGTASGFDPVFSDQVDWNNLTANQGFWNCMRDLILLKTGEPAMHTNNLSVEVVDETNNILVWRRYGAQGEVIQFAANVTATDKTVSIPFPSNGEFDYLVKSDWANYGGGDSSNVGSIVPSNFYGTVTIPAYGFIIFGQSTSLTPSQAAGGKPGNNLSGFRVNIAFSWDPAFRANFYQFYLGSSQSAVSDATPDDPEFVATTNIPEYWINGFDTSTTYYWRVDSVNSNGITKGQTWKFTTTNRTIAPLPAPAGFTAVPTGGSTVQLTWEGGTGTGIYLVTRDGENIALIEGESTYLDSGLQEGTTYSYTVRERNTDFIPNTSLPVAATATTPVTQLRPFVMDGAVDSLGYLHSDNGMLLYAAVRGTEVYVATNFAGYAGSSEEFTDENDHHVFVSDTLLPSASAPAPWAKDGFAAVPGTQPFMASEGTNDYIGWFNVTGTANVGKFQNVESKIEGSFDMVETFGSVPAVLYLAAVAYQTDDAAGTEGNTPGDPGDGFLLTQVPAGNGDNNIDPDEFLAFPIHTLDDHNSDGLMDRLDPAIAFTIEISRGPAAAVTLDWAAIPGRDYQVQWYDTAAESWADLPGGAYTCPSGADMLSHTEPLSASSRMFRVVDRTS